MPNFVFAYHGGKKPETPEEGQKAMAAWNKWFQVLATRSPTRAIRSACRRPSPRRRRRQRRQQPPDRPVGGLRQSIDEAVRWPRAARSSPTAAASRSPRRCRCRPRPGQARVADPPEGGPTQARRVIRDPIEYLGPTVGGVGQRRLHSRPRVSTGSACRPPGRPFAQPRHAPPVALGRARRPERTSNAAGRARRCDRSNLPASVLLLNPAIHARSEQSWVIWPYTQSALRHRTNPLAPPARAGSFSGPQADIHTAATKTKVAQGRSP